MTESARTPEAAFLVAEVGAGAVRLLSYGDCRLMVVREQDGVQHPFYTHATVASWLGAFSALGMRQRLSVADGVDYRTLPVAQNDIVLTYTDGIDEPVYETSTIGPTQLAQHCASCEPSVIFDSIMQDVFAHGAHDHASLAVVRVP
jgi:hypothetical protein